jgi:hypothetical protein
MIEVRCYSGYKGMERPKSVVINGREKLIQEILKREVREDYETRERTRIFWCQISDGVLKLSHLQSGEWKVETLK